ncbi:MAG: serine/threonine-protein phosphatase [Tessaracoccus sp.]|uniref:PP2C family protein-serine/threonine phosphatase n=1 Tax=Tessaracoccus sp. TaxID=1971211 RepID=UPI001EB6585E|nr:protein phosphatase 2C domain-containing protein [Tessaracoccus sp.]MBK7822435.1 serine/threonine-protein phosphatase [Tessaracoccus sp.]
MLSLRVHAHSEVGRVRKNNQDSGYASPTLLLVADGMGGAAAGDLASAVAATEAAKADTRAVDGEEMLSRAASILTRTNARLSDLIDDDPELDGMGTTFCGAFFNGEQFGLCHIGDSRGYLLRGDELTQLTHDHSWVQSLIDEGKLTPAQAAVHPHRSLILKVLNGRMEFEPDLELLDARIGDRIMFCSDGLSGMVDDIAIRVLLGHDDLATGLEALAQAANAAGGHDNITIVAAEVVAHDEDLDARAPLLVGSVTEVTVPQVAGFGGLLPHSTYPTPPAQDAGHDADEVARYAPHESHRRWPGALVILLAVALTLGLGTWGLVTYARNSYFVAAADGYVAVYNGLPGSVMGFTLSSLIERTDIPVADLPRFYQRGVEGAISVSGRDAATVTTSELRAMAERCVQVRKDRQDAAENPRPDPAFTGPGLPVAPGATLSTSAFPAATRTPVPLLTAAPGTSAPSAPEDDMEAC